MKKVTCLFLQQVAKDYDIDLDIVVDIFKRYPDKLYEKLEEQLSASKKI